MKKRVIRLLFIILFLTSRNSFAQVFVGGGYLNVSDITFNSGDKERVSLDGLYAGASYDLILGTKDFFFSPGLFYSLLFKNESLGRARQNHIREHFINAPLYFNASSRISSISSISILLGPTIQYGIASTIYNSLGTSVKSYSGKVDLYKEENYRRTNVLIGGGVRLEYNIFRFIVGCDYGLLNLNTANDNITRRKLIMRFGVSCKINEK